MTMARKDLVDVQVTRYYHCISRCVRQALLCGAGREHRKQWIEDRLQLLAENFAVSVCGFSVMDNHLHVLVRLDPDRLPTWSAEEVVRRWFAVYPPRGLNWEDGAATEKWIAQAAGDSVKVERWRRRLGDLGWFMKALKEPLSRLANKEDRCKGTFWEARYKSIAILDEESLLATCAYIDLNPLAAGVASAPETSPHTSLRQRVRHARSQGQLESLKASARGAVVGSRAAGRMEELHWLCPLEDRRRKDARREGMLESFSLGSYLLLVDYTARLCRSGKARLSAEMAGIFERLGTSAEFWDQRLKTLFAQNRLVGSHFASDRQRLRELAAQKSLHHLDNLVQVG
jgi:REP element-mobilizing transposase RayT